MTCAGAEVRERKPILRDLPPPLELLVYGLVTLSCHPSLGHAPPGNLGRCRLRGVDCGTRLAEGGKLYLCPCDMVTVDSHVAMHHKRVHGNIRCVA